jgi:hypothetical protein
MSNWIDYQLDVLATSPAEINQIAERLNQPSAELASWVAQRDGQPVSEVAEDLKELLKFKTVKNLGYVDPAVNKAQRFSLSFKNSGYGIVDSHLAEVSEAFPKAIFLLEFVDMQASYSGKRVMRVGQTVREVFDGDQKAQGLDWALLDIFAPYRTEYFGEEHEFGSLWASWLDAIIATAESLRHEQASTNTESTEGTASTLTAVLASRSSPSGSE